MCQQAIEMEAKLRYLLLSTEIKFGPNGKSIECKNDEDDTNKSKIMVNNDKINIESIAETTKVREQTMS